MRNHAASLGRVRRTTGRSLAVVLFLVGLGLTAWARPALAYTCHSDNRAVSVTLSSDADDPPIVFHGSNGQLIVGKNDIAQCGPIDQIDSLTVDLAHHTVPFGVDLSFGPLGPGFTPEPDGHGEIEIKFLNVPEQATFNVHGADGDDDITVGRRLVPLEGVFENQVNLNAAAESSSPDADVTFRGTVAFMQFGSVDGTDRVRGVGIGSPGSQSAGMSIHYLDGDGADTFVGGTGDDVYESAFKGSVDSFSGGGGVDSLQWEERLDDLSVSLDGVPDDGAHCPGASCEGDNIAPDVEQVFTGQGNDVLVGGPGDDLLVPGDGTNSVSGNAGNDTFEVDGTHADQVHGGPGKDLVTYQRHGGPLDITLDGSPNDGLAGENDNVFPDVENVIGSAQADRIVGSAAANTLIGFPDDDVLFGMGGNDVLDGGFGFIPGVVVPDGSDVYHGGPGRDTAAESDHSQDLLLSIDGVANDRVAGHPELGVDDILPDVENVLAGQGDDIVKGSAATNKLTGGPGSDRLEGGGGNDVLVPNAGNDQLTGDAGRDTVSFAGATASIVASLTTGHANGDGQDLLSSVEALAGAAKADQLTGSGANDALKGGGGDDVLRGLAGNDRLTGGKGDDTLNGGTGVDTCVQGPGSGSATGCEH